MFLSFSGKRYTIGWTKEIGGVNNNEESRFVELCEERDSLWILSHDKWDCFSLKVH
jgi:hypothetical protein